MLIRSAVSIVYPPILTPREGAVISAPPGEASCTRTSLHIRSHLPVKRQNYYLAINTLQAPPCVEVAIKCAISNGSLLTCLIVQGTIRPDRFLVFKPRLAL